MEEFRRILLHPLLISSHLISSHLISSHLISSHLRTLHSVNNHLLIQNLILGKWQIKPPQLYHISRWYMPAVRMETWKTLISENLILTVIT